MSPSARCAERRPSAFPDGVHQHALLFLRIRPSSRRSAAAMIADAELEVRILVLLHLARQTRRGLERDLAASAASCRGRIDSSTVDPILYCRIIVANRSASDGCDASIAVAVDGGDDVADLAGPMRRLRRSTRVTRTPVCLAEPELLRQLARQRPARTPAPTPFSPRALDPRAPARPTSTTVSRRSPSRSNVTSTGTLLLLSRGQPIDRRAEPRATSSASAVHRDDHVVFRSDGFASSAGPPGPHAADADAVAVWSASAPSPTTSSGSTP